MALHLDQKLATCLWFANEAEPAARFYTSIFPRSRIDDVLRWGNVGPGPKGAVLMVTFSLMGEQVLALNGNTQFPPTPAASLSVLCDTQAEIDRYWKALLRSGGKEMMCGWLTDRFGISWQIVPRALPRMIRDKHQAKADRAMAAMMGMVKIEGEEIVRAVGSGL